MLQSIKARCPVAENIQKIGVLLFWGRGGSIQVRNLFEVPGQRKNGKYVVAFAFEGKRHGFYVSEFSYSGDRINETGMLKYRGDRLLDFS